MKLLITFLLAANLFSYIIVLQPTEHMLTASEDVNAAKALDVGRAYLAGISLGTLDSLDELFVLGDKSSVYENGSNEGTWLHYKEHHLAPEQEAAPNLQFTVKAESTEAVGDGFLVKVVGSFSVEFGEEARTYRAAVSFLLIPANDELKILHLHWSSKQIK